MTKWIVIFIIGILFESAGLVLLKEGMTDLPDVRSFTVANAFDLVKAGITNPHILAGVFCQALFFACMLILMIQTDISFLWPLTGLGFVVATIAGIVFLHEQVSAIRWTGVILSMMGAALISMSGHTKTSDGGRPNTARGCVKSADLKFGNDQIFAARHFDETSRWIGWSKNEFSHRLALEPTAAAPSVSSETSNPKAVSTSTAGSGGGGSALDR
jgi:multidrug transporter EmrE-like cation transporter